MKYNVLVEEWFCDTTIRLVRNIEVTSKCPLYGGVRYNVSAT